MPALVHARWFTPEQAGYLGAANLMGYAFGALFARRLARLVPLVFLISAAMVVVGLHFLACSSAMDFWQQALRSVELAIDKCRVEDQLRLGIRDLGLAPRLDLALHRFEVPLDAIHSDS